MDYRSFLVALGEKSGYDFSDYSGGSISRRLQKICDETGMTFEQILDRVVTDKAFVKRIVEDITVNTTELFRDPDVWTRLYALAYRRLPRTQCTVWHAACSTGLEVYSNLILLNEMNLLGRVRVIGTDINEKVLETARKGEYAYTFNKAYVENFDAVMRGAGLTATFDKYFEVDHANDLIRVKEPIRGRATFMTQNLVTDKAPFPYMVDMVFLRNVMIYFNDQLQQKILADISSRMYPGAVLVMGKQEDVPQKMTADFTFIGPHYLKN